MNLFRSEEHVRAWPGYDPASEDGIKPVADLASLFSLQMFRERLAPDYLLRLRDMLPDWRAALERLGGGSSFWQVKPPA